MSNASLSCGVPLMTGTFPTCTGNGVCVYDPVAQHNDCSCNKGWTGDSDFKTLSDVTSCHINTQLIQALWGIMIALQVPFLLKSVPNLIYLIKRHGEMQKKERAAGRSYSIRDNKGLFSVLLFVVLGFPLVWALAIIKIAEPWRMLGKDVLVTILFWLVRFFFFNALLTIQPALLKSLLRGQRNLEHIISGHSIFAWTIYIGTNAVSLVALWPLVTEVDPYNPVAGMASVSLYFLSSGVALLTLGIQALYIERKVVTLLSATADITKDGRSQVIKQKLSSLQRSFATIMLVQSLIQFIFGAVPMLWPFHAYQWPISWMTWGQVVYKSVSSITHNEQTNKSGDKRGSVQGGAGTGGTGGAKRGSQPETEMKSSTQSKGRGPSVDEKADPQAVAAYMGGAKVEDI